MEGIVMDRVRRTVALPWIAAIVGFPIGGYLGHAIAGPAATALPALLSGLIAGAIIGLGQALSIGLRGQPLAIWVGGTAAGLAIALAVVTAAIGQIETSIEAVVLGVVSGLLIGAAQAAVLLRVGTSNAWLWIPATAVAWGVGWLVTSGIGVALAAGWPVYGLSGALASQVITAIAIWRLVTSRDNLHATA
jgi:hypothetical protein